MLENYLRITLRSLRKHPAYTAINVLGLAGGVAVGVLMLLYAANVLTWDGFHAHADDTYFVYRTRPTPEGPLTVRDTWAPVGPTLESTYPEVVRTTRILGPFSRWVEHEGTRQREEIAFADPSLLQTFDIPLARGDAATVFADPLSMVVSPELAARLFGAQDPLGQTVEVDFERTYTVTGVLGPFRPNTSFRYEAIAPLESLPFVAETGWGPSYLFTFAELVPGTDPAALERQFPALVEQHVRPAERGAFRLQPLRAFVHDGTSRPTFAYLLLGLAGFTLLIACINFTNLATARSLLRGREVGVRKVLGAQRGQLVRQFLSESFVVSALALVVGVALAQGLLPFFNEVVGLEMRLPFGSPLAWLVLLGLGLAIGLVAGGYPAFFLARLAPAAILKGGEALGRPGGRPGGRLVRHGLVVVQFALSIVLLVGIGVIDRQVDFMKGRDLRFDGEHVVVLPVAARDFADAEAGRRQVDAFADAVGRLAGVAAVARSSGVPGRYPGSFTLVRPADAPERDPLDWRFVQVDAAYFDLYDVPFVEGRNFSDAFATDVERGVILNEAALRTLGWPAGVGRTLLMGELELEVVGVVADFHYQGVQQAVEPVLHFYEGPSSRRYGLLSARLHGASVGPALAAIQAAWREIDPGRTLDYFFVDERFAQLYETEENMSRVIGAGTLLALLIAGLGLFGLVAFTTLQRTKEIGVRKVLGATVGQIVALVVRQFAVLVALAFVVAVPLAYLAADAWLADFAYRAPLGPGLFLGAGLVALGVALATVGYQAMRAALADPVDALRYE